MTEQNRETKAQRIERQKLEKNPWRSFEELERFAREGCGSIPPEWLSTYFRWWGIYTQGDGVGAVGGTGGEGKPVPYFTWSASEFPTGFFSRISCARLPISPRGMPVVSPTL